MDKIGLSHRPIKAIEIYPNGTAIVKRVGGGNKVNKGNTPKREAITKLSFRSRARMLFVMTETSVSFNSLMTLTYGKQYPVNGQILKEHLNRFLVWYKRRIGPDYFWWLEFQERGAPHIHIASPKIVGKDGTDRIEFALQWRNIVIGKEPVFYSDLISREKRCLSFEMYAVHQHRRQWSNVRERDGAKRYLTKYAFKTRQKTVPPQFGDVGRFWGCSRWVKESIGDYVTVETTEEGLRRMLPEHRITSFEVIPKYIFGVLGKN